MSDRFWRLDDEGQEVVEYALIFPLLLLLLLGIVEFGWAVFSYGTVANAAREGARYGIIHPDDNSGIVAAARQLTSGLDQAELAVNVSRPSQLTIRVEVVYDHRLITGWMLQALGGSPTLTLRTVATMNVE